MFEIKSERHNKTLVSYINTLLSNKVINYVNKIYLYGSCARGDQTFYSDIDLFVVLREDTTDSEFWKVKSILSGECMLSVSNIEDADIDIHYTRNSEWFSLDDFFYKQIRKDCILLWERNKN